MEASLAGLKIETDFANRPVTMFGDNDIGNVFAFRFRVIDVISINKHDDVGILLDAVMYYDIACHKVV